MGPPRPSAASAWRPSAGCRRHIPRLRAIGHDHLHSEVQRLADCAFAQQFAGARQRRIEEKILEDLQAFSARVGRGDHTIAFRQRHGHGFLHADVRAAGQRSDRHRFVQRMRGEDLDQIEVGAQKILEVASRVSVCVLGRATGEQRGVGLA